MESLNLIDSFTLNSFFIMLPYIFTFGAALILFIFHSISFYYTKDKLIKDFCKYLLAISIYIAYAIFYKIIADVEANYIVPLVILNESLEILSYYFYINYTTNAIGFDEKEHKLLNRSIKMTLYLMLLYIPLQVICYYGFNMQDNAILFIGIRAIIFSISIVMFYQSIKIKDNRILPFIQLATFIYFLFSFTSFILALSYTKDSIILPYHLILLGTLVDLIVFSTAMSNRVKHHIIIAEKLAADKEIEIQAMHFKQELALKEQNEENRKRLAMDLHDDVGATLSSLKIYSELAEQFVDSNPTESKKLISKVSIQAKEVMRNISDIIWSMRSLDVDQGSIKNRIIQLSHDFLAAKNIVFELDFDENIDQIFIQPHVRKNIILIIKESFNNIAKYSQATKVNLSFKSLNVYGELKIIDNGIGFDMNEIRKGQGLNSIASRSKMLNGTCKIMSSLDEGTIIECRFNLV